MNLSGAQLLVKTIVEQQRQVMGPMAIEEANKVAGLKVSTDFNQVVISGSSDKVLTELVLQYKKLFGQTSVEVCRDSVKGVLHKISSATELPEILR